MPENRFQREDSCLDTARYPIFRENLMKLQALESVRGVSTIYVALGHIFPGAFLLSFGQEAVIIFFLLSGFVIEYSSAKTLSRGFKYYFQKRFIRIYSVLLALFSIAMILEHSPVGSLEFWRQLAGNLLMLQDFSRVKPNVIVQPLYSSALWSLHYEWWFYMFYFPLAANCQREKQTFIVFSLGVIAAITYVIYPNVLNRLLLYFPIWWTGVIMARAYVDKERVVWANLRVPCFLLVGIAAILAIDCIHYVLDGGKLRFGLHPFLEFRHVFAAILVIYFGLLWQKAKWFGFQTSLGWGAWIAPISYALYISHQPLLVHANYWQGYVPPAIEKLLYLAGLILFCWVTELWLYPRLRKMT